MRLRAFYMLLSHVLRDWFSTLFRPISLARVITLMIVLQVVKMKPLYVCNRSVLPQLHQVLHNETRREVHTEVVQVT